MADGSSGLSLSEMGISTVKKSAKVVQQAAKPFVQGAKQQLTGSAPAAQAVPPSEAAKMAPKPQQQSSQPPSEGTVFDIFSQVKQQVSGTPVQNTSGGFGVKPQTGQQGSTNQGGTVFTPPAANVPNENTFSAGNMDLGNPFGEKNPFGASMPKTSVTQQPQVPKISEEEMAKKHAEDKQRIETLRQKLFNEYKEEFIEKAEGKKQQGEDTYEQRKQREEKEEEEKERKKQQEEQKMEFIAPTKSTSKMPGLGGMKKAKNVIMNLLKPKQGSKEGRSSKG